MNALALSLVDIYLTAKKVLLSSTKVVHGCTMLRRFILTDPFAKNQGQHFFLLFFGLRIKTSFSRSRSYHVSDRTLAPMLFDIFSSEYFFCAQII